jgi:hypothetical protein
VLIGAAIFWGCHRPASGPGERPLYVAETELEIGVLEGPAEYQFGRITGLAMDSLGRIFVVDALANEVRVFTAAGEYAFAIGREGAGPGELQSPCSPAFDHAGYLWIRDASNGRYNSYEVRDTIARFRTTLRMPHGAGGLS